MNAFGWNLGGWGDDGGKYSRISASSEKRKNFTTNAIEYLHKYGFDGLDIDWEFPVCWLEECGKGHDADKANFGKLLQVKNKFKSLYSTTS